MQMDKQLEMETRILRLETTLSQLREKCENYENHCAVIENFVEKYVPIKIHEEIMETCKNYLPQDALTILQAFAKKRG